MVDGLFVAVPTREYLHTQTAMALFSIIAGLTQKGVPHAVRFHAGDDIVRARNRLAAAFLALDRYSHILFVDPHVSFEPQTFERLMALDAPFAAAACPHPRLDLDQFRAAVEAEATKPAGERASTAALASDVAGFDIGVADFDGKPWSFSQRNGYLSVPSVDLGLALIRRDVFLKMIEEGSVFPVEAEGEAYPVETSFGYFSQIRSQISPGWLSAGQSFCKRWIVNCCGEIWIDHTATISYISDYKYTARLADKLARLLQRRAGRDES